MNPDIKHEIIEPILKLREEFENAKRNSGLGFNILDMVTDSSKEHLHTHIITSLLNPEGGHGQGITFLRAFIAILQKDYHSALEFLPDTATVCEEKFIGPVNLKDNTGGQVDIYLKDSKGHIIMIENKIEAKDQSHQLMRYHNHAPDGTLIYLHPFLTKPSFDSVQSLNENQYLCMSYSNDILKWLGECRKLVKDVPFLSEAIHSYELLIRKYIHQDIKNNYMSNYIDYLVSNEKYIQAAMDVANAIPALKARIESSLFEGLYEFLDSKQMKPERCSKEKGAGISKDKLESAAMDHITASQKRWEILPGIRVKIHVDPDEEPFYCYATVNENLYFTFYSDNKEKNSLMAGFRKESKSFEHEGSGMYDRNECIVWMRPVDKQGKPINILDCTNPILHKLACGDRESMDFISEQFMEFVEGCQKYLGIRNS